MLFSPRANALARSIVFALVVLAGGIPLGLMAWVRTPQATGRYAYVRQPVPFDHRIHVHALGIDCRYCHATAERSAYAGIPPTTACVSCHNQVWLAGAPFAPVRASLASGRPIPWRRVNALPDFVYFDHAIHVAKHVDCATCHGDVGAMGTVRQVAPLTMSWCVDCHRERAAATNCSTCHR